MCRVFSYVVGRGCLQTLLAFVLLHFVLQGQIISRIERRDKKAFLSDQCKEIRKTIEWERLEISSKKIRDTKGTFHAKMGTIKDRNSMDLTEAEILRRGGKNTQKNCTKNIFMTQIITMV